MTEKQSTERRRAEDESARNARALRELLEDNAPMVHALAGRYTRKRQTKRDLVQEGYLGLLRAAEGFDASHRTRFSTYARYWVRYYLQRFARRNRRVATVPRSRAMVKARNKVRRLRSELAQERGESISDEELAERLGLDVDDVAYVQTEHSGADVSMHPTVESPFGVQLEGGYPDPETVAQQRELEATHRELVEECLAVLDGRERHIIDERILSEDKHTLASIGEDLGISRERVRQLEKRALKKMREHLGDRGYAAVAPRAA